MCDEDILSKLDWATQTEKRWSWYDRNRSQSSGMYTHDRGHAEHGCLKSPTEVSVVTRSKAFIASSLEGLNVAKKVQSLL